MQPSNIDRLTTDLNPLFYLYRRDVQTIPLLSKEEELVLYQAIESRRQELLRICTADPKSLEVIHAHFAKITAGELRLETLLHGATFSPPPPLKLELPEVQQRLFKLLMLQYEAQSKIRHLGIKSPKTQACQERLLEDLMSFKWTALLIDKLAEYFQSQKSKRKRSLKRKFAQALIAFKQAKEALTNSHLRLVLFLAKKYTSSNVPFLDLVQEGNVGLIQAVERFDYSLEHCFSTYAYHWIKPAILKAVSKFQAIPNEESALENLEDQATPTPLEVASALNLRHATEQALSHLPLREADILKLRFGIGHPRTHSLHEVGEIFKVGRERIRQIEAKALKALRDQVQTTSLKTFLNRD